MSTSHPGGSDSGFRVDQSILLVVGAHPHAELHDRPVIHRLRSRIEDWQDEHCDMIEPMRVVVCTDLWYLNDAPMMRRPTIALGRPGVNAATAYYANKLPAAFTIAETVFMHFDPEFLDQAVCLWGRNDQTTAQACDLFADRYLERFLQSVHLIPMTED